MARRRSTRRQRHREDRHRDLGRQRRGSLWSLLVLVPALVWLLMSWDTLALGAAGCLGSVAGPSPESPTGARGPEPSGPTEPPFRVRTEPHASDPDVR